MSAIRSAGPYTLRALRQLSTSAATGTTTTATASATQAATGSAASAAAGSTQPYVTFAQYRVQATKNGQLAAVRQAYPRSLNTQGELKRAAERAQQEAATAN